MSALYNLWKQLSRSKQYRETFAASVIKRMIPLQIRTLRNQHEWSQARLAKESKLTQGVISRAEDPDYGNLTVNTLVRIAAGFDCVFVGRLVPFSELGKWYINMADEKSLEVPPFIKDDGFIERTRQRKVKLDASQDALAAMRAERRAPIDATKPTPNTTFG